MMYIQFFVTKTNCPCGKWRPPSLLQVPSTSHFDLSSGLFSLQIQPQSGDPVTAAVNGSSLSSSACVPIRKGVLWQQGWRPEMLLQYIAPEQRILCFLHTHNSKPLLTP